MAPNNIRLPVYADWAREWQRTCRFASVSIAIAAGSLLVASSAVIVACSGNRTSQEWQKQQIPLLERIAAKQVSVMEAREVTARTFEVGGIVDGATFKIVYDGEETSVRLCGIDAPGREDPNGPAATQALKRLIGGKAVRVEFPGDRKRDSIGRLLCNVYLDGKEVGAEMIRSRHAKPYMPRGR